MRSGPSIFVAAAVAVFFAAGAAAGLLGCGGAVDYWPPGSSSTSSTPPGGSSSDTPDGAPPDGSSANTPDGSSAATPDSSSADAASPPAPLFDLACWGPIVDACLVQGFCDGLYNLAEAEQFCADFLGSPSLDWASCPGYVVFTRQPPPYLAVQFFYDASSGALVAILRDDPTGPVCMGGPSNFAPACSQMPGQPPNARACTRDAGGP